MKNSEREFNATFMPRARMHQAPLYPPAKRRTLAMATALAFCGVLSVAAAGCTWQWRDARVLTADPRSADLALPIRFAQGGEDSNGRRVAQIQQINAGDGHRYYWCYDDGCKQPTPKTPWTPPAAQSDRALPLAAQANRVLPLASPLPKGAAARIPDLEDKGPGAQTYAPPVPPVPLVVNVPGGAPSAPLPPIGAPAVVNNSPATPTIVYEEVARVIHFRSGKTNVDARALAELNMLMPAIENADFIVLRGLTDSDGNTRTNKRIAITRAIAVKDLLVSRGIKPAVIAFTEAAGTYLAPNDSSDGKSRNRAVELKIRIPRT